MQILTGGDEMEFIKIIVSFQSSLLVKHLKINTITYVFEFHINIYQVLSPVPSSLILYIICYLLMICLQISECQAFIKMTGN